MPRYGMATIDPRTMDPESAKRLASGFWTRSYDFAYDIETWTCDKRKLQARIQAMIMQDRWSAEQLSRDPERFLDGRYGKGTCEAYRHSSQDRVAMRFNPHMGMDLAHERDQMAYYNQYSGTTGSGTLTNTTATAASTHTWLAQEEKRYMKEQMHKFADPVRKSTKLVRNLPFVCGSGDLLNTLQRDFDHWSQQQRRILFS